MKASLLREPSRSAPWSVPGTATACFDAMMEHTADGEIPKAVACALEYSRRLGAHLSVMNGVAGLENRIRALEATARRCPQLRRPLASELARLRAALELANGAAHRLCWRRTLLWPRPAGANVLREIKAALKVESAIPTPLARFVVTRTTLAVSGRA